MYIIHIYVKIQKESNKIKDSSKGCLIKEIRPYIDSQANMKSDITWGGVISKLILHPPHVISDFIFAWLSI